MPVLPRDSPYELRNRRGARVRALWQAVSSERRPGETCVHARMPEMWHGGVFDHCPREAQIVAPATQWENMSRNALDREVMRPKTATRRSQINQPEKWMLESSSASDPKRQPNTSSTRAQTSQNRTQAWIADDGWSNCRQLQIRKDRNSSRIKALRRDFCTRRAAERQAEAWVVNDGGPNSRYKYIHINTSVDS